VNSPTKKSKTPQPHPTYKQTKTKTPTPKIVTPPQEIANPPQEKKAKHPPEKKAKTPRKKSNRKPEPYAVNETKVNVHYVNRKKADGIYRMRTNRKGVNGKTSQMIGGMRATCEVLNVSQVGPTCFFNAVVNGLINNHIIREIFFLQCVSDVGLNETTREEVESGYSCPLIKTLNNSSIKHVICNIINNSHTVTVDDFAKKVKMRTKPFMIVPGGYPFPTLIKFLNALSMSYDTTKSLDFTNLTADIVVLYGPKQSAIDLPPYIDGYTLDHAVLFLRNIKYVNVNGHIIAGVKDCFGENVIIDGTRTNPIHTDWTRSHVYLKNTILQLYPHDMFLQVRRSYSVYFKNQIK